MTSRTYLPEDLPLQFIVIDNPPEFCTHPGQKALVVYHEISGNTITIPMDHLDAVLNAIREVQIQEDDLERAKA